MEKTSLIYLIDVRTLCARAYIGKEEDIKGSIEPWKLADMVVLDKDILSVPHEEEIKDIQVLTTIVDGRIVYQR